MPLHFLSKKSGITKPTKRLSALLIFFCVAVGLFFIVFTAKQPSHPIESKDIPLPCGLRSSATLKGQLSTIGSTDDNHTIVDMTFDNGEISEAFGTNDLTFIVTPSDPASFSSGAPLSVALTAGKKLYGYKYESKDAILEQAALDDMRAHPLNPDGSPRVFYYADRFPGTFFAPASELADSGSTIATFIHDKSESGHLLNVSSTEALTLESGARYLIIAEESGVTMTVRNLNWCGDGVKNATEECDGINLNGATCISKGFAEGELACVSPRQAGQCTLDTSGCRKPSTIFVTTQFHNGNFGGLTGADAYCRNEAQIKNLSGNRWKALLSDRYIDARDRIVLKRPLHNERGELVAQNESELWSGNIRAKIADGGMVFTGTESGGSISDRVGTSYMLTICDDWTSAREISYATLGYARYTDKYWLGENADSCSYFHSIYCMDTDICTSDADCGIRNRCDAATGDCVPKVHAYCGNGGVPEEGEACDDGNRTNFDGCSDTCTIETPVCANGHKEAGEVCDDGNYNYTDACSLGCKPAACGDGFICLGLECHAYDSAGEDCDDGNTVSGDGCSSICRAEHVPFQCGNGVPERGEECDDGNNNNGDECNAQCKSETLCNPMNGKPDLGEECDDNNLKNDDACTTMCRTAICGDGHLCSDPLTCTTGPDGGREQCDDGNAVSGDGCSMTCAIESDSICRADPGRESLCRADNQVSFQGAERVDPPVTALPTEEYRGVGREVSLVTYHGRLFAGWTEQYRTFATDGGAHPFVRRVRVAAMTDIPTSKQFYWESVEGTAVPGLNSVSGREGQNIKFFLFGDRLYVTWTEWQVGDINTMRIAVYNDNDANPSWVSIDAQKPFFVKLGGLFSVSALPMILNGELLMVWETDTAVHLAAYNGNDAAPDWTERTSWHPTDGTGNVDLLSSVVFNGKLYISYVHYALSGASRHVDVYTPETPSQPWSHVEGAGLGLPGVNACKQPQLSVQAQSLTLSCLAYRDIQPGNLASITYNGNDAAPAWVGMLRSNLIPALNYTLTTFNGNTYIAWLEQWVQNSMDSDPTKLRISIADSSSSLQSWSAVDGGSLNAVFGSWGQGMSFATLGNTIFIGWAEASGNVEWGKIHILRAQSR